MNLKRLAGFVIFVLLLGITSNSLTNSAFGINTSHEKSFTNQGYKTNVNVPKDKYIEDKIKEAKKKVDAEIKHLKDMAKSKPKGYSKN